MDETETTSLVAPTAQERGEYWSSLATTAAVLCGWEALERLPFPGSLARAQVGEFQFIEVVVRGAAILRHSRVGAARTCQSGFSLKFQLEGQSVTGQDGREAQLSPGDFTLCDDTRPCEMHCEAANRLLVVRIPEHLLRRHVANVERLTAVAISGADPAGELLSAFVRQVWTRCSLGMDPAAATHITHALLNLIAAAYALVPQAKRGRPSMSEVHRMRIRSYIEKHLTDHNLTPESIAEACNIKSRYLRKLYESEHESLTRYILRRRLEECATALASEAYRDRTVTEIAFSFGFNSVTHFGRVFRERYGVTPSEYRVRNSRSTETPAAVSGLKVDSWGRVG